MTIPYPYQASRHNLYVPFNDLPALERVLAENQGTWPFPLRRPRSPDSP